MVYLRWIRVFSIKGTKTFKYREKQISVNRKLFREIYEYCKNLWKKNAWKSFHRGEKCSSPGKRFLRRGKVYITEKRFTPRRKFTPQGKDHTSEKKFNPMQGKDHTAEKSFLRDIVLYTEEETFHCGENFPSLHLFWSFLQNSSIWSKLSFSVCVNSVVHTLKKGFPLLEKTSIHATSLENVKSFDWR